MPFWKPKKKKKAVHKAKPCLLYTSYAPDGKGGLFTIRNPRFDMRSMEIWYQMNCYLNEIIREGSLT